MNIIERITKILKEKNIQQKELTEFLNISQSRFSDWKIGKIDSYYKFIPQIAQFLNVSTDYLLLGKDEVTANLSEDEKRLVAAYREHDEGDKKAVRKILDLE